MKVGKFERITSRVSEKGQVTIPRGVRRSLGINPGDGIVFEVREGEATIRKLPKLDVAWTGAVEATLDEWEDALDDEL